MAAPSPAQCGVFIQAWVDVNAIVQGGGAAGAYLVDNRINKGSTGDGSASLTTACSNGEYLCWTVASIDPNAAITQLQIQQIGSANAWGNSGQPEATDNTDTVFTGQVQNAGTSQYNLVLNVNNTSVTLTPSVAVSAS